MIFFGSGAVQGRFTRGSGRSRRREGVLAKGEIEGQGQILIRKVPRNSRGTTSSDVAAAEDGRTPAFGQHAGEEAELDCEKKSASSRRRLRFLNPPVFIGALLFWCSPSRGWLHSRWLSRMKQMSPLSRGGRFAAAPAAD